MSLRIRFRDGPRAGEVLEFEDSKGTVRFGRDADHCDVVFPASDTKVSREHFSLTRVNGQWRLVTNRKNPVLVDGREGDDEQILDDLCRVQVGVGGPKLIVEVGSASSLESTIDVGFVRPPIAAQTRAVEREARKARGVARLAVVAALLLAAAGYGGFEFGRRRIDATSGAVAGALDRMSRFENDVADRVRAAKASFRSVYDQVEKSVYRVERRTVVGTSESYAPVGTAWVVAQGRLATNAHVAKVSGELGAGEKLVVRSATTLVDVVGTTLHPGFDVFDRMVKESRAFDPAVSSYLDLVPACDVALLDVAPADATKLGPPLVVAPRTQLEKLDAGDPIAFVGYPCEGFVHAGTDATRLAPTFQVGHVTGVTDFFFGRAEPAAREFVHFSMPSAGGASGSPLLDEQGRVVGVLNAGNFTQFYGGGARIPLGGVNYGQRADLLTELLERKADANLAQRTRVWQAEFDRLFQRGVDGIVVWLTRWFESYLTTQHLANCERTEEVLARDGTVTAAGDAGAQHFEFVVPHTGWYLVVAVADRNVDLDAAVTWDGNRLDDVQDAYFARIPLHVEKGRKLDVTVLLNAAAANPSTTPKADFKLHVYRAVERA